MAMKFDFTNIAFCDVVWTPELEATALALHKLGLSPDEIAEKLGYGW
jgi:hypothetical protein